MQRIALAAFALTIAWLGAARADDVLDRGVHFNISPSPLASALIDFSTQSGIQVAVADADVSHVQTNGVSGTFPVRAALSILLRGTGLEFSRVGVETVVIRTASAGAAIGAIAGADGPGAVAKAPAATAPQPEPNAVANASPDLPEETGFAPRPPTEQEIAGDSVYQFIVHHATLHYVNLGVTGDLAHWRGGRPETICPVTLGLEPRYNDFVTARIRALATIVGAPMQPDLQCKDNVRIVFTAEPQKLMAGVAKWASAYFGVRYPGMRRLVMFDSDHAIQGWYITTRGGGRVLNADPELLSLDLWPLWPQVIPSGLHEGAHALSGIVSVILIVDTTRVAGYPIGTIADYVSELALTVVQSPDHCDPLPSILDVMSTSCGTREKPTAITAGDLAFLNGLYYHNTGWGSSLSRDDLQRFMMRQFKGH
jgi:hypothetical protein